MLFHSRTAAHGRSVGTASPGLFTEKQSENPSLGWSVISSMLGGILPGSSDRNTWVGASRKVTAICVILRGRRLPVLR